MRNDITEANAAFIPETLTGAELGADYPRAHAQARDQPVLERGRRPDRERDGSVRRTTVAPCGFVPAGGVCRQRQNLGRTEIQRRRSSNSKWQAHAAVAVPRPAICTPTPRSSTRRSGAELEGNRLAQVPESQGSATIEWSDPDLFSVALVGRFVTDQFEDDLNSLELSSSFVVDLAFHIPVNDRWNVFVACENVFDKEVESGLTADGLLTIGTPIIIHGGFRLRIGT